MESIVLFDPSIRSLNLGDHIISRSVESEIEFLTKGRFVIHCATHSPVVTFYQNTRRSKTMRFYDEAKYKFVCGSNLFWKRMLRPEPSWNINPFNSMPYENCILLGVGTHKDSRRMDFYTRRLYKGILNKEFIHSARDEAAKALIENLGLKALNTGCPTMWRFTDAFCNEIPDDKASSVVFTLTDYSHDAIADQKLINVILKNYEKVWFWPQGAFDLEYLYQIYRSERIRILSPTLQAFEDLLNNEDIDYVGTRLHAGIFAMQHKKRSIIIAIDNRVRDMRRTYGLLTIDRSDMDCLEDMIARKLKTRVGIDITTIDRWKSQFS